MTKPPANWQDQARAKMKEVQKRILDLVAIVYLVKDALRADNYKAYLEAVAWFNAEEREP